jgi:hypothetical protein
MSRTEAETLEAHIVNHLNRILEHRVTGRSASFSQRFDDSIHQSISQKDTEHRSSYHECNLAIGAVVGVVVYLIYIRMYYRISPKIKYISNQYTSAGYDYDDVDKIMTVVIFTLIMVVFYATCQMANL